MGWVVFSWVEWTPEQGHRRSAGIPRITLAQSHPPRRSRRHMALAALPAFSRPRVYREGIRTSMPGTNRRSFTVGLAARSADTGTPCRRAMAARVSPERMRYTGPATG